MAYADPFGGGQDAFKKWLGLLNQNSVDYQKYNSDPQDLYSAYANVVGSYGSQNFMNWINQHYQQYWNQYSADSAANPTLKFTDYLSNLNPAKDYSFTSPYQRGDMVGSFAPTMRMVT